MNFTALEWLLDEIHQKNLKENFLPKDFWLNIAILVEEAKHKEAQQMCDFAIDYLESDENLLPHELFNKKYVFSNDY